VQDQGDGKGAKDMKVDMKRVDDIVDSYGCNRDSLISILQDAQSEYRYLPEDVIARLRLPIIQVYGVATFFKSFSLKPRGEHLVHVCLGTACHVRGAPAVLDEVKRQLDVETGETSKDMRFTLETVNCLGACALGPIMVVDGDYQGQMRPGKVKGALRQYKKAAEGN
jgi:NADH:ubiquinone oxidoreductase subunit E